MDFNGRYASVRRYGDCSFDATYMLRACRSFILWGFSAIGIRRTIIRGKDNMIRALMSDVDEPLFDLNGIILS